MKKKRFIALMKLSFWQREIAKNKQTTKKSSKPMTIINK